MQLRVRLANNLRFDDNIHAVGGFIPRASTTWHMNVDIHILYTTIAIHTYKVSCDASTPKCCKLIYIFIYTLVMWVNFALSWICCFDMPPVYTKWCTSCVWMWKVSPPACDASRSHISRTLEHRIRIRRPIVLYAAVAKYMLGCWAAAAAAAASLHSALAYKCVAFKWNGTTLWPWFATAAVDVRRLLCICCVRTVCETVR